MLLNSALNSLIAICTLHVHGLGCHGLFKRLNVQDEQMTLNQATSVIHDTDTGHILVLVHCTEASVNM